MILLWLLGCSVDPCDEVIDLSETPLGLDLTEEEHPGWGNAECFQCHQAWRIHANSCVDGVDISGIDPDVDDTRSCSECHGENGVSE